MLPSAGHNVMVKQVQTQISFHYFSPMLHKILQNSNRLPRLRTSHLGWVFVAIWLSSLIPFAEITLITTLLSPGPVSASAGIKGKKPSPSALKFFDSAKKFGTITCDYNWIVQVRLPACSNKIDQDLVARFSASYFQDKYTEAIELGEELMIRLPKDGLRHLPLLIGRSYMNRGIDFAQTTNMEEALKDAEKAMTYIPDFERIWQLMAASLYYLSDPIAAAPYYEQLLKCDPENPVYKERYAYALLERGIEIYKMSDFLLAASYFEASIKYDPRYPTCYKWLGNCYRYSDPAKAKQFYLKALSSDNPDFPKEDTKMSLATLAVQEHEPAEAHKWFSSVIFEGGEDHWTKDYEAFLHTWPHDQGKKCISTEHFKICYDPSIKEKDIRKIEKALAATYPKALKFLQFTWKRKIPVVLEATVDEYQVVVNGPYWTVRRPTYVMRGFVGGDPKLVQQQLERELISTLVCRIVGRHYMPWVSYSTGLYFAEGPITKKEWQTYFRGTQGAVVLPRENLVDGMSYSDYSSGYPTPYFMHMRAYGEFLIEGMGLEKFHQLCKEFARTRSFGGAFYTVLGIDYDFLDQEVQKYLEQKHGPLAPLPEQKEEKVLRH